MERITRTITTKEAKVIFFDVKEMKTGETIYNVNGRGKTADDIIKNLRKSFETDDFKIVAVKEVYENTKLYAMDIDKFMQYAEQIDHR